MPHFSKDKYRLLARGKKGFAHKRMKLMINKVEKSLTHAYKGRKLKKRTFRRQRSIKINAASREHNLRFSQLVYCLRRSNIGLNRKTLAELAEFEPFSFKAVIDELKIQGQTLDELGDINKDMDIYEALAQNYLVYGDVKEIDPLEIEQKWIEADLEGFEMTDEERAMVVIDKRRPHDEAFENVFRL